MKYYPVVLVAALVTLMSAAWGQGAEKPKSRTVEFSDRGLIGISSVNVVLGDLDEEAQKRTDVTQDRLRTFLTAALIRSRTVGIAETEKNPYGPTLYLNTTLLPLKDLGTTVYSIQLGLQQCVSLPGAPPDVLRIIPTASTWNHGSVGISPDADLAVRLREFIDEAVDAFAVDWAKENPRPAQ